ncbi:MAG TPA: acyl-CoA dehydrogenase family protein, partial [Balneolaceae bacterium]|nr:acyl-CoA dehydrogenase family protein [Balneolaceae bacterium]
MSTDTLQEPSKLNFSLSEEQQLIRESVKDFVERHVAPSVKERDAAQKFPLDVIKKLAQQGFMGMVHPEKYGGGNVGHVSFCLAIEEIARWDASLALTVASHTSLASGHIALAANESQKEKYLTPLAKGEKLGAWCLTEPGSGSDASGMKTTAVKKGNRWVLNGSKIFITQGSVGGIYVVLAKTDPKKGTKGISAFIVERDWDGVEPGNKMEKLGMNSSDTTEVHFEN